MVTVTQYFGSTLADKPIQIGDIIWAGDPGYVGRARQINPVTIFVETSGSEWTVMTKDCCSHATKSQRKEYFKNILKYGN
jgi:hypothetical protein